MVRNCPDETIWWVRQVQMGERVGMCELAKRVEERMGRYFGLHISDHNDREDLLQETLLTLMVSVGRLRKVECFWPWMYRVARSKVQQHYRERSNSEFSIFHIGFGREGVDDPLEQAIDRERLRRVFLAIGQLKEPYRQVVRLRCLKHRGLEEIASVRRTSKPCVRVQLFRGRRILKAAMNED